MSSYEEQNNENFKLVSLDGTPRPGSQQAKRAYSSYLKDDEFDSDSSSNLQISEVDPTAAVPVAPPPKPVSQPAKKPQGKPKGTQQLASQPLATQEAAPKNKNGKSYSTSDDGVDLFDGDPQVEDVSEKLDELKDSVSTLLANFKNTFAAVFMKSASIAMKPIGLMAGLTARLANIPLKILN
ncbi:hypothetical protein EON78_06835, partial [bacterium]